MVQTYHVYNYHVQIICTSETSPGLGSRTLQPWVAFWTKGAWVPGRERGGRWGSGHAHRQESAAATCSSHLARQDEAAKGAVRLLGTQQSSLLAISTDLTFFTDGTHMGNLDPPPVAQRICPQWHTHSLRAACNLETQRLKFPSTEKKPQELFSVLFVVPTSTFVCTPLHQVEDVSGLQLALLPPQPNASTSAKAGMKEAFQRKQTNPVTPDKRLQEVVNWQSSWHSKEPCFYNQTLPLPAISVLLTPTSTHS